MTEELFENPYRIPTLYNVICPSYPSIYFPLSARINLFSFQLYFLSQFPGNKSQV